MNSDESLKCPKCGATVPSDAPLGLCPRCLAAMNLDRDTFDDEVSRTVQKPLAPEELAPHFPQLEILECLGRGGMGVVYKARQKSLNRLVALKLLAPERGNDAHFAERFTREAQALAKLAHPNIVTIHDFGQAGSFFYLLMEYVDGANLRQALNARNFTPEQALSVVPPVCEALQYAHEHGIVHRDIKPENLLLDRAGRVKIADFGIAKMLGAEPGENTEDSEQVGTPHYMAPEQRTTPRSADHRADIYSLGVVLYEMLTGELPGPAFRPPSRKVTIDVRLDEIVMRALEKSPELRWQTADELRTRVETIATVMPATEARKDSESGRRYSLLRRFWRMSPVLRVIVILAVIVFVERIDQYFADRTAARSVERSKQGNPAAARGDSIEAGKIRLRAAENDLKRANELRKAGLIAESEYQDAETAVELARAELAGDPTESVRIRVRAAERALQLATIHRDAGLISSYEYDKAEFALQLAKAELSGDPKEPARIRVRAAERALKNAATLREEGRLSELEYQKAVTALELARAEITD